MDFISNRGRVWALLSCLITLCLPAGPVRAEAPRGALRAATDSLGIYFEPNLGQTDPSVHYLVRAEGYTAFLTDDGAVFAFDFAAGRASGLAAKTESGAERGSDVLRMSVVGADTAARLVPERPVAGVSNYLVGPDETAWLTGVPHFGSVRWAGVYDGVDLRFHGNGRLLEYDFEVAPGADASRIRVRFEGQQAATVDEQGDLVLRLAGGDVVQPRAYVYQGAGESRREVASRFELDADGSVAVALDDDYDRSAPLVIDPTVGPQPHPATVNYNDYLGGRDDETAGGIAVDASGAVYVAGNTRSGNFPTTSGSFDRSSNGGADVFVTKLSAGGGSLVYSTFIGGTGDDAAYAIAVDSWHTVFMTGATRSADFPTTPGSYDGSYAGSQQAFVTRLSANGDSLVYSTFLGGSETQTAYGLTLDGAGAAYVTGETNSDDFPTTPGAYLTIGGSNYIGFVTKVNPGGSSLGYSTLLGEGWWTTPQAVAVDASGAAYVTGTTADPDFPTTPGAFDRTFGTVGGPAFVTKLSPSGGALVFSTFLGDSAVGSGIAVDAAGAAYVTGHTESTNFPTTPGAYDRTPPASSFYEEGFVTKFSPSGDSLTYSTFLGGSSDDSPYAIAVDSSGYAYVAGCTDSADFPRTGLVGGAVPAGWNLFVTKLGFDGSWLVSSTVLGGDGDEGADAIAIDGSGHVYVAGQTTSSNFATTGFGGHNAASVFVMKLTL